MSAKPLRWILTGTAAGILLAGGWMVVRRTPAASPPPATERLFDQVLSHVRRYAVDSLDDTTLYRLAADGMLEGLEDDYAALLVGDASRDLTERTTGNYGGVGVRVDLRGGTMTVVASLPDSPAERAGIRTGDQIVEIDGVPMEGGARETGARSLRGEEGTEVKIALRRPGVPGTLRYSLVRATIHRSSVTPGVLLEAGIAYLALNPVSERSAEELETELGRLKGDGMRGLILDLRGNPGGVLEQGVQVADLFLDRGSEIVAIRGRTTDVNRTYLDGSPDRFPGLPIAVLVDEGTASAAEIVAGALQDHDRALVLGQPTFGKGIVQTVFPLGENVALRLTTARWFTPSGRTIQRPDILENADSGDGEPGHGGRPPFHTAAGRVVFGGGGIVPDLAVPPDTSRADGALGALLRTNMPVYREALTWVALDLKARGAVTDEHFPVTDAMRAVLRQRLLVHGIDLPAGFRTQVDRDLGNEIARYVFGRGAEIRRRAGADRTVREAMSLLRRASTPRELFAVAATPARDAY